MILVVGTEADAIAASEDLWKARIGSRESRGTDRMFSVVRNDAGEYGLDVLDGFMLFRGDVKPSGARLAKVMADPAALLARAEATVADLAAVATVITDEQWAARRSR